MAHQFEELSSQILAAAIALFAFSYFRVLVVS